MERKADLGVRLLPTDLFPPRTVQSGEYKVFGHLLDLGPCLFLCRVRIELEDYALNKELRRPNPGLISNSSASSQS